MSPDHKSAVADTLITQEYSIGMGSISKLMVKEEGKTEVGNIITSNIYVHFPPIHIHTQKITGFEVGRGVKVYTVETRVCFGVQEVWSKLLKLSSGGFYLFIHYMNIINY